MVAWKTLWFLAALLAAAGLAEGAGHVHNTYEFIVKDSKYKRLCQNKTMLTVNGQWPGPTITARRGENVTVHVSNQGSRGITIHWHGVDQPRNPWFDGPELITQCPIKPGQNFTYHIILSEEEGTLWWHAHSALDRAGIHGAFVVHPEEGKYYPFEPKIPHGDHTIILSEWWKGDLDHVFEDHVLRGGEINSSDAHTINGFPGDFVRCARKDMYKGHKNETYKLTVDAGYTYLLRIINAGMDNDMFFSIAGHKLTVVGTDGRYLKQFTVETMMISPGQTMDVLLTTDQPRGNYYMGSRPYASNPNLGYNKGTATAILHYRGAAGPTVGPNLPPTNSTASDNIAIGYTAQLRSLASPEHPANVPKTVDKHMLITIAINSFPCTTGPGTCGGPRDNRLGASLNNVSFEDPVKRVDILDAYYYHIKNNTSPTDVYQEDFPDKPTFFFNFTDPVVSRNYTASKKGTKVTMVEYGAVVEVVFQDTAILGAENHPMHLHGYAFYVVGRGLGNYNNVTDPATYNLRDPPYQNTVTVPRSGWAAIRFHATNPGVWFMHCHFDRHTVFGMSSVFIVKDGPGAGQQMGPRPSTMPVC